MAEGDIRKVYVASSSMISPLGSSVEENMKAIEQYKSAISLVDDRSVFCMPLYAAKISEDISYGDKLSILEGRAVLSVKRALEALGKEPDEEFLDDVQLIFSSTKGDIGFLDPLKADFDERVFLYHTAKVVADFFKIKREPLVISNACISGVNAVITGSRLLRSGFCNNAIILGADLLSRFVVTGFYSFHSISTVPCTPYDAGRDGLTLGEAVGTIIMTVDRGFVADADAVLVEGGGVSNDANHLSAPSRSGDGLAIAIDAAMAEAGVSPGDIDFINAHGTATIYNDEMEAKAIHLTGLSKVPVQSLKPYWGHTLGASGVIESIGCFWQMKHGILFGTKGYENAGVPMEINVTAGHRRISLKRCLKSASGFGGCNAAVIYSFDSVSKRVNSIRSSSWKEISRFRLSGNAGFHDIIREWNRNLDNKDVKFFKMDDLSKLGYIGALALTRNFPEIDNFPPEKRALFFANSSSSLASDLRHMAAIGREDDLLASPAIFVYTLPNTVLGEISIKNRFKGENTFFVYDPKRKFDTESQLLRNASLSGMDLVIAGWCDLLGEHFDLDIALYTKDA
jgi:3-oxoacyl-[acyl-carrier-protein] synthase-1